jgi:DNA polymerase-3 subunit beta
MKFTVLQENFYKAVSVVTRNISTKTQLPILSNVLLQTEEGRLKLAATNLETTFVYWIGASIETEGAFTVPARILHELVSSFSADKVEIELVGNQLLLKCGESEATLSGIEAGEFPPLPTTEGASASELDTEVLSKSLPFVLVSASSDETRPILTGVKFMVKDTQLQLVATDGYRLSIKNLPLETPISQDFLVSARALSEIIKLIGESKEKKLKLYVSANKNQIIFELDAALIATRLIEGEYPLFERIIPKSCVTQVVFDKAELLKAVKFAAIYARESANILKMNITSTSVVVSANSAQIGSNKTTLSVKSEGEGGEIAFNSRFLLDLLTVFPEDDVLMETNGALSPGVFKSTKDDSLLHIIMPVRVQG